MKNIKLLSQSLITE